MAKTACLAVKKEGKGRKFPPRILYFWLSGAMFREKSRQLTSKQRHVFTIHNSDLACECIFLAHAFLNFGCSYIIIRISLYNIVVSQGCLEAWYTVNVPDL